MAFKKYFLMLVAMSGCCTVAYAGYPNFKGETTPENSLLKTNVYVGAYGGYGSYDGGHNDEGNTAFGRLALGAYFFNYYGASFGLEAGLQSGNQMAIHADEELIEESGGLVPQVVIKPTIDLLAAIKMQFAPFSPDQPISLFVKGGIAYREMQFTDRTSYNSDHIRKINGEAQVGIGFNITQHVMVTAFYQGIYSDNNVGLTIDATGDNSFLHHIPTEQAGFLGLEYTV